MHKRAFKNVRISSDEKTIDFCGSTGHKLNAHTHTYLLETLLTVAQFVSDPFNSLELASMC